MFVRKLSDVVWKCLKKIWNVGNCSMIVQRNILKYNSKRYLVLNYASCYLLKSFERI